VAGRLLKTLAASLRLFGQTLLDRIAPTALPQSSIIISDEPLS
jgi:hypothetical protein